MRTLIKTLTAPDETIAELRQHGGNDYSLTVVSRPYDHNRWGTKEEIEQDCQHFLLTGSLPYEKNRFF